MEKELCTKFGGVLIRSHEVIKLQKFAFSVRDVIPANVYNMLPLVFFAFFVTFMRKIPPIIKFYGVFHHFSWTCEVAKFDVSDVMHASWQAKYANCGLHVTS